MSYFQALAVFLTVAEEKSFSAAAKKLSLSQPTVSFHIDSMEKHLGCPLFVRTRRGVEMTVYGKTLYENTVSIKSLLERTERKIQDLRRGVAGTVQIGAGTVPGEYILPVLLTRFLREHANVSIHLNSGDSRSIYRDWLDGKMSICILGFQPSDQPEAVALWSDEIIPVAAANLAAELPDPMQPEDLLRFPQVSRTAESASRIAVQTALEKLDLSPRENSVVFQVGSNEAMKRALQAGAGIGFLSRRAVETELGTGLLLPLRVEGLKIVRRFYGLKNNNQALTVVEAVWNYLLESVENAKI